MASKRNGGGTTGHPVSRVIGTGELRLRFPVERPADVPAAGARGRKNGR